MTAEKRTGAGVWDSGQKENPSGQKETKPGQIA